MIIDDEPKVVDSIREALEKEAYEIVSADNGREGLEILKKENPVLIILDLRMPVMDGIEFLEHVKLLSSDPHSIIALTGHGDDAEVKKCFQLGISVFVRKPFNIYELRGLVKHSIALKHAQMANDYLASFPQLNINPVLEVDSSGTVTYYNNACIKVLKKLGLNEDLNLFLPKDMDDIRKALEQEKEDQLSREIKIKDRTFAERIHLVPKFNVVRIYIRDITERKQAEEQLRKLSIAVEQSPSVVVITDVDGNIEYANPKFTKLTGYTLEETIGKNLYILKSGRQSNEVYKQLWSTITSGIEWHGELHNRKKSGEHYWEAVSVSPIKNAKNIITHFVKVGEDITRRKEAEEDLQKHHFQLEDMIDKRTSELKTTYDQLLHAEKLNAVGKLSASIAHEFNNPIFGILNVLERIKEDVQMDEGNKEFVDMAIRECDRMAELIRKLQDFHRPSAGNRISINIHEIIDDVLMLIKKKLTTRSIKLEKVYSGEILAISAIPDQIKQVILNLLSNAEQAISEEGGTIAIETEAFDTEIAIHIKDSGCGIKDEEVNHIFEPFFTTKGVKGSGLGLSISYGIIKEHGGNIKVESLQGKGTTFIVTLPVRAGG